MSAQKSKLRLLCQVLLLSTVAGSTGAFAQEGVEVVTVTAAKRAQNIQDVPMAITVLGGQAILENKDRNLHDLITRIPNLNFVTQGVNDVIYLRGFGSSPNNFAFDPDVSIYEDGIYGGRSGQFIQPIFDVQRVEVLKGPQGALVGKNTAAGAISIVTADPQDHFEAMANLAYNFDMQGTEGQAYVTGPITDKLSGRLAFKYIDQDGFLKNLAVGGRMEPHTDQKLVRGGLKFTPTEDFDVTAKVEFGHSIQTGGISTSGPITTPPPRSDTRYVEDPYGPTGLSEVNGVESWNGSVTANYHYMDHTITSITGYSSFHRYPLNGYDETNPNGGPTTNGINNLYQNGFPEHFNQVSEELRVLSPTGKTLEYVFGGYWDNANWDVTQNIFYKFAAPFTPAGPTGGQFTYFQQASQTWSAFGDLTWNVTDALRVKGSLRYTAVTKTGNFGGGNYFGTPMRAITTANGHLSEDHLDPSATVQYDVMDDVMVYFTYARGSKSGGFVSNTFGTTNATFMFAPETSTNYELGAKGTFDDGHLSFDIALFDMTVKNLQVSAYVPAISSFITRNAASASSKGVEAHVTWFPIDELELSASAAYLDAHYDRFIGGSCLASEPVSVCNPASPASLATHDLSGLVLEYTSKWTGTVRAKHTWNIPDSDLKLESTVVGSLRSTYFNADNYHPIWGFQPTTVKWDARLQLGAQDDHWNVAIAGKNLFGIRTISNTLQFPASVTTQTRTISYMDPYRQIWIEGTLRF
jgi:iron complex outermembrane receptor protein